jgi:hypothetical protein
MASNLLGLSDLIGLKKLFKRIKEKTFFKKMSFLAPIQYLIWQMSFQN